MTCINDKNCELDEFDCCVNCCECKNCIKLLEDCFCGNNIHKGLVKGRHGDEMRCEDCDIDGVNYQGGLTDEEEEKDWVEMLEELTGQPTFIKWTAEDFCDRDTCYFCKTKDIWQSKHEDAVCDKCAEVWKYDEDDDGYRKCE